jgi:hypothetical protein
LAVREPRPALKASGDECRHVRVVKSYSGSFSV